MYGVSLFEYEAVGSRYRGERAEKAENNVFCAVAPLAYGLLSQPTAAIKTTPNASTCTPRTARVLNSDVMVMNKLAVGHKKCQRVCPNRDQGLYQATSTFRPCTTSRTLAPTGRLTLVSTWPKGRPVSSGTLHTERSCATAVFKL